MSLKRAREKRDEARTLLADGIDPGAQRKALTQADAATFVAIAREWFGKASKSWAPSHADKIIRRLERDVFPYIGARPMAALSAADVSSVSRRITERNATETAHRACQSCGQVFRYAVAADCSGSRVRNTRFRICAS